MRLIDADALNIRDVSTDYNSKVMGVTKATLTILLQSTLFPFPKMPQMVK